MRNEKPASGFEAAADLHVTGGKDAAEKLSETRETALLLLLGDLTHNGTYRQLNAVRTVLSRFNGNWAAVPGNHDVRQGNWKHFFSVEPPVFKWRNKVFHGLDSSSGKVPEKQVKSIRKVKPDVVFLHHVVYSETPWEGGFYRVKNREELQEAFNETGVDLVLQGHRHIADSVKVDRVRYVTLAPYIVND